MTVRSFRKSRLATAVIGISACLAVGFIVLYPDDILQSSLSGLGIWWKIVFPALLPFYILIEMMRALGIVHFIAVLLEPVMRLFALPGVAGWCTTFGWTAGSPAGASHIAELRRSGQISREQGERLLAIAHTASPVLIIIVIAAGFLGNPLLGIPLVAAHWLGAILVALATRTRRTAENKEETLRAAELRRLGLLKAALLAREEARQADGRPFGKLLGDSVFDSIQKLFVVGGYMIFFSVVLRIIMLSGIGTSLIQTADSLLALSGLPQGLSTVLFYGLFEQHLGAYALLGSAAPESAWQIAAAGSAAPHADVWSLAAVSAVLGWSGLCMHAQVKAAVSGTDLRYSPFVLARLLHAVASAVCLLLVYPLLARLTQSLPGNFSTGQSVSAWVQDSALATAQPAWIGVLKLDAAMLVAAVGTLLVFIIISTIVHAAKRH